MKELVPQHHDTSKPTPEHDEETEKEYSVAILEHDELKRIASATQEFWKDTHDDFREDIAFSYGAQWKDDDALAREGMGLPSEVFNICDSFIKPLCNAVRKSPPSITVHPISQATKTNAQHISGILRSISYASNASRTYMQALEQVARGGIGAWKCMPEKQGNRTVLRIKAIPDPTTLMPDPSCQQPDFSDAEYFLNICTYKSDIAKQLFPGHYEDIEDNVELMTTEVTIFDLWIKQITSDGQEKIIQYRFDDTDIIEIDDTWVGERFPFVFLTGERAFYDDRHHFHGIIRGIKHVQKHINYIESEAIACIGNRIKAKFMGDEDAIKGHEEAWNTATTKQQSVLYHKKGANIVPVDQAVAINALTDASRAALDMAKQISGIINDPGQQMSVSDQSGKAIALQQSQAAISTYNYIESLEYAIKLTGEILLDQVRGWLNNDGVIESMSVDKKFVPVSLGPTNVPDVVNIDLGYGTYGVSISSGASYATQREELIAKVFDLCAKDPQYLGLLGDWLFSIMDVEGSSELSGRFRAMLPPPVIQFLDAQAQVGNADPAEVLPQVLAKLSQMQQQLQANQNENNQLKAELAKANDRNNQELMLLHERGRLDAELFDKRTSADISRENIKHAHDYSLQAHKEATDASLKVLDAKLDALLEVIRATFKADPAQAAQVDAVQLAENIAG